METVASVNFSRNGCDGRARYSQGNAAGQTVAPGIRTALSSRFADPAFRPLQRELDAIVAAAWDGYSNHRKAPHTRKAGPGFADPDYDLSVDWLAARDAILAAQRRHDDADVTPRILLINGSSRSEHTCPGEMSKSWRLVKAAETVFAEMGFDIDVLDLSRLTSEFGKQIHPCKSCVSTAMPLCHWPCSCYPNYSLQQTDDWMNEIFPLWVAARGIMIVTPVNWYHAPTGLKAMIDRLVCADGGNPDPTSTHGKKATEAKALELKGWAYPKHLEGRHFAVVVHGDTVGAEEAAPFADGLAHRHVAGAMQPRRGSRWLYRLHGALRGLAPGAGRG